MISRSEVIAVFRALTRNPQYSIPSIVILTVGISAAAVVISIANSVLLRDLPYNHPRDLFVLMESDSAGSGRSLSHPTFLDVAGAAGATASMAYVRGDQLLVQRKEGAVNLLAAFVSNNFFDVITPASSAKPLLAPTDAHVIVLSRRIAHYLFGSSDRAIGQTLSTATAAYTVVGVLPEEYDYPAWADAWVPLDGLPPAARFALTERNLHVDSETIVRLHADASPAEVSSRLSPPIRRATEQFAEPGSRFTRASLTPLKEHITGNTSTHIRMFAGAVALLLILTCANVSGILASQRLKLHREVQTRLALGATKSRLFLQLLNECMLLTVLSAIVSILVTHVVLRQTAAAAAASVPRASEIVVSPSTLLSIFVAGSICACLISLAPAMHLLRSTGYGRVQRAKTKSYWGAALVVSQVGGAVVLLGGALALVRSARLAADVPLGFSPENVTVLRIFPSDRYPGDETRLTLYTRLKEAIASAPGVQAVALVNHAPMSGAYTVTPVDSRAADGSKPLAIYRAVSSDFFYVVGATIASGRVLNEADTRGIGVVVNQALAKAHWPNDEAVGQSIVFFANSQGSAEFSKALSGIVVGVVRDLKETNPDEETPPILYAPINRNVSNSITLLIRTSSRASGVAAEIQRRVHSVDRDIPMTGPGLSSALRPLSEFQSDRAKLRVLFAHTLTGFAAVSLILSCIGLAALLSSLVTNGRRDISIRMAVGASPGVVAKSVVRRAVAIVSLGSALGFIASLQASKVLRSLLYGATPYDVTTMCLVGLVFSGLSIAAAYFPARRAARTPPMLVLRGE